jgi:ureidoacrylate peracid hydrolase
MVESDHVVTKKNSFAAFYGSDGALDAILKEKSIDTVLIGGLQTSICCETTAREASVRGLKTIMVSDANAGRLEAENFSTYSIFLRAFGDVATSAELITIIEQA